MNPLFDLRKILATQAPRASGVVIEAPSGDRYRIRASSGTVEAAAAGNAAFAPGDEVMVRDGVILGRIKPSRNVRAYTV